MNKELSSKIQLLIDSILELSSQEETIQFLDDLCTVQELEQLEQRLQAAKMLIDGATYEEVIAKTSISSATLSRVSKCVHQGNGYKTIINKLNNKIK